MPTYKVEWKHEILTTGYIEATDEQDLVNKCYDTKVTNADGSITEKPIPWEMRERVHSTGIFSITDPSGNKKTDGFVAPNF